MTSNNNLRIELTSTAVTPTENGYYTFDQMCFLFPHEPIRRELNRGKLAFDKIDFAANPWKTKYIRKWLSDFLIPMIHDHHDAEENYLFPSYVKLGVKIPDTMETGHEGLVKHLNQLEKLSEEVVVAVNQINESHSYTSQAANKFQDLKQVYEQFYIDILAHLAEEETFWPPIIKEKGEQAYQDINAYMHKETKNQKSAKLFIMSVFDSMGYEFDINNPTHDLQYDTRWCGEELLNEKIINKIPYFVRSWIFPPMNRQYQYYKQLIHTVAISDIDNVPLEFVDQSSSCIIA
eukprot:gene9718-10558_t